MTMEMSGKEFTQQMLSDLMAMQKAIMDIEKEVRNIANQAGVKANLGFLQADDTIMRSLQSIFQQQGYQDKGPDQTTKNLIDTSNQILSSNAAPRVKFISYLALLNVSRSMGAALARAAFMNGDKNLWEKLAVVHLADVWKHSQFQMLLAETFADAMSQSGGGGGGGTGMGTMR